MSQPINSEFKALTISELRKKYEGTKIPSTDKIGPLPKDWKRITIDEIPHHNKPVGKLAPDDCLHCGYPAGRIMGFCDNCLEAMRCGTSKKETVGIGQGV